MNDWRSITESRTSMATIFGGLSWRGFRVAGSWVTAAFSP